MASLQRWAPGTLLTLGCVFTLFIDRQERVPLAAPLTRLPVEIAGYHGVDAAIGEPERRAAGMDSYLFRTFSADTLVAFTLYVGYYEHQTQGRTIHSPKNCLPGSGWEALQSSETVVSTPSGPMRVNRYLLQNKAQRALVYYWYQGRGRVAASEYQVKWELFRDSALRGRSEEALVRIVIPINRAVDEERANGLAQAVAASLIPAVATVLPAS